MWYMYMETSKPMRKCSLDDLLMFKDNKEAKKEIMMRYKWWKSMKWKNFSIKSCISRVEQAYNLKPDSNEK